MFIALLILLSFDLKVGYTLSGPYGYEGGSEVGYPGREARAYVNSSLYLNCSINESGISFSGTMIETGGGSASVVYYLALG